MSLKRWRLSSTLLALMGIAALVVVPFVWLFQDFLNQKTAQSSHFTVASGWSLKKTAQALEEKKLISSAHGFQLLSMISGQGHIKAGDYTLHQGMSPVDILDLLRRGQVNQQRITFPEGFTAKEILKRMRGNAFSDADELPQAADATAWKPALSQLKLKQKIGSLEGWLFPDTYFFRRGDTAKNLVKKMLQRSQDILLAAWQKRDPQINLTPYQTLIFASIIEKETGAASERAHISAVFHNRMRINMPLQSDPTVIYGIKDYDGNITRKHLRTDTPYNTYTRRGLPPTPICNPGSASIDAALHPKKRVKDLYFVALGDGSGKHAFARTLSEHNRNVQRYLKRLRQAR
ncbi:endolytic transglycosylase MltG [Magnetococcales bacterium HHB-1]